MLSFLSIAIEIVIFVLALQMVFVKKRFIGIGLAVTFGIYAFYDMAREWHWGLPKNFTDSIFFVATCSAFLVVWVLSSKKG